MEHPVDSSDHISSNIRFTEIYFEFHGQVDPEHLRSTEHLRIT